ncbi:hypothetical protein Aab01nite_32080 [Paractinoplanes abujensis]|uniref:Uncharacterized protein n=1 Tax=Paractinoplanes abujensis TaxID=882441 RepID=A0A7W7G4Z8_9ACTN|nr:hypothetical protein [Actinoplanes abujensis]MBB4697898.1 hypothetical protein [Actinoplanes abujensis]GID19618.1 hypothetical protein Aab01nite_32080 [Actinoplanes abujensis]
MRWHRPLLILTAAMAALTVVTLVGIVADDRVLLGAPVWLKPFKFAISFAVYAATLAWMLAVLPRRSRFAEWAGTVIVAVSVIEVAIIAFQAARGHRSHFNDTNPFDERLWSIMGASIMVLFVAHLAIGVVALRQRLPDRVSAYAIRLGLFLSLLGMAAAVPMVTPMQDPGLEGISGAHAVGVPDGGPGLPVTGWSTTGGDLRIGHFVGLHGLQFLPLLALLLTRRTRLGEKTGARLILVAGLAYAGMVVLLTWQALRGQPLLRPDGLTLAALAGLLVATAVAVPVVLRTSDAPRTRSRRPVARLR